MQCIPIYLSFMAGAAHDAGSMWQAALMQHCKAFRMKRIVLHTSKNKSSSLH